jgi:hypothetical protein
VSEEQIQRRGGGLSRFLLWLAVLGLLAAVWWLASERNQRRFSWGVDGGRLVISKGNFLPVGARVIPTDDPKLGKIYGPIPLPPGANATPAEFEDQTALDRALFDLIVPWAKADLKGGDPAAVERAGALVERADGLPGLTAGQHHELAALRGELSFSAAKGELHQAAKLVLDARRKLDAVREGGGEHALDAAPLVRELEGIQDALEEAAQGKSHGVYARIPAASQPARPPATPAPGPAAAARPDAGPPPRGNAAGEAQ